MAPAILPGGQRICLSYRKQRRAGLYVLNASGTLVAPQGTAPHQNIFRLDLQTGEQRQLTSFDETSGASCRTSTSHPTANGSCSYHLWGEI